jgi:hypothetical protein
MPPALYRATLAALSGTAATMVMTAAMARMHGRLPAASRYPLPPRELTRQIISGDERSERAATMVAHFAYGAATGALFGLGRARSLLAGAGFGIAVWGASYIGWIPALGLLEPATKHPPERNGLMVLAHVVWGAVLALGLRDLEEVDGAAFSGKRAPDA